MNNSVFLDDKQFERMLKEVPKILVVTRAVLCEKFKVGGAVARALIKELAKRGVILPIGTQHHSFDLYKGAQAKSATEKAEADAAEAAKGKKKKAQDD
jgi:ribosomal protein S25